MATQAQILANRRNSEKSTGPRTAEGKAAVAKNATKHGLFARKDVVISENQADFDAFRDDILAELGPVRTMESILAGRIVSLTWRLKRAERMQNEVVDAKIRREINSTFPKLSETLVTGKPCDVSKYSEDCYDDLALGYIAMWDFAGQRALERLLMYEKRIESSLYKAMKELQNLQRMRERQQAGAVETEPNRPSPSLRDEAATQSATAPPIPKASGFEAATQSIDENRVEAATRSEGERLNCEKQSQFVGSLAVAPIQATRSMDERVECEKQSQTVCAESSVKSIVEKDYGDDDRVTSCSCCCGVFGAADAP